LKEGIIWSLVASEPSNNWLGVVPVDSNFFDRRLWIFVASFSANFRATFLWLLMPTTSYCFIHMFATLSWVVMIIQLPPAWKYGQFPQQRTPHQTSD
jgi:hypothetical protein